MNKQYALDFIVSSSFGKTYEELFEEFNKVFRREVVTSNNFTDDDLHYHANNNAKEFIRYCENTGVPSLESLTVMWTGVSREQGLDDSFDLGGELTHIPNKLPAIVIGSYYEDLWMSFKEKDDIYMVYHDDAGYVWAASNLKDWVKLCLTAELYNEFDLSQDDLMNAYAHKDGIKEDIHLFTHMANWCKDEWRFSQGEVNDENSDESETPHELLLKKYPESKFVWQDAYYCDNPVEDMGTSHLFYTLRMCWNEIAPSDLIIDFKKDWGFSLNPVYCKEYFQLAVVGILAELSGRNDISHNFASKIKLVRMNLSSITSA